MDYTDFVTDRIEGFLVGLLPTAMALGEPVFVEAPISPRLASGLREYQRIQNSWWPDEFHIVEVNYEAFRTSPGVARTAVGSSFSGGVDSFHTLWQHLAPNEPLPAARITHCLMINGFDKDVDLDLTGSFQSTLDTYVPMMRNIGVRLLVSRNNLQAFRKNGIPSKRLARSHAAPLAASALILGNLWGRFYIPGARPYDSLVPDGAHPMLDHLFSTEELVFCHDGAHSSRPKKIESITEWPETHSRLRVCFKRPTFDVNGTVQNCCKCLKCTDTMLALDLLGVLDRYVTFPHRLKRQQIWKTPMRAQLRSEYLGLARRNKRRDRAFDLMCSAARSSFKRH